MKCATCGLGEMVYSGVGDGFGKNGNLCCEVWQCEQCLTEIADECFNCEDDEQFGSHEQQLEEANKK